MNHLPDKIEMFLKNDFKSECEYLDETYIKVQNDENYISLYRTNDLKRDLTLILVYSIKEDTPVLFFEQTLFDNYIVEEDKLNSVIIEKIRLLIEKEFYELASLIKIDDSYLLRNDLIEKAKDYYIKNEEPSFDVLSFINIYDVSFEELIQIVSNPLEYAYNLVEKYIKTYPVILENYKEFLATEQMFTMLSRKYKIKDIIYLQLQSILFFPSYRNLTFVLEKGDGTEEVIKVKTKNKVYEKYPFYAIKEVLHGKVVLYKRNLIDLDKYKLSEELNLLEFQRIQKYERSINENENDIIFETTNYINDALLDSESFIKNLCKLSMLCIEKASNNLKNNPEFMDELLSREPFIRNQKIICSNLSDELKSDVDFCLLLLQEYGGWTFAYFNKSVQQEERVLKEFAIKCKETELELLTCEILEDENLCKILFETLKENKEYSYKFFLLPNSLVKHINNEDFALKQLFTDNHEVRFCELKEKYRFNKAFVCKYINLVSSFSYKKYFFSSNILNYLSKDELDDKDLMYKILLYMDFSKSPNLNCFDLSERIFTEELYEEKVKRDATQIKYFPPEIQYKLIENEPLLFKISSVLTYKDSKKNFYLNLLRTYPFLVSYIKEYNVNQAYEFVKEKPETYISLDEEYKLNKAIISYVYDKIFILDVLPEKTKENCKNHPINNKDFVLKQFELGLDTESRFHLLSYIPKKNKKIDNFSLRDDRDVVLAILHYHPRNILLLENNSVFFKDKEIAKLVCIYNPTYIDLFRKEVKFDIETLSYIYQKLTKNQQLTFLDHLPTYMQKKIKTCL